jgi:DNA-binding transcriptional MerR regulator
MPKSADAFRTISEVADWLGIPAHVLRFWESKFTQVKPVKRAGGRRYYRPVDMQLLGGIRKLLHDEGMTIKGVQKIMRDQGMRHVAAMSPPLDADLEAAVAEIALDVPDAEEEPRGQVVSFGRPQSDTPDSEKAPQQEIPAAQPQVVDAAPYTAPDEDKGQPATAPAAVTKQTTDEPPVPQEESLDAATTTPADDDNSAAEQTPREPVTIDLPLEEKDVGTAPSDAPLEKSPASEAPAANSTTSPVDTATAPVKSSTEEDNPVDKRSEKDSLEIAPLDRMVQPADPEDGDEATQPATSTSPVSQPSITPIDTPDDPGDTEPAPPSVLTQLAGISRSHPRQERARLANITGRLTDLRARMSNGGSPR